MKVVGILLVCVSLIAGTVAETCYGATENLYCMFGCCSDVLYIYCCLSNGAGIGIIVAAIVIILSLIGICLRRSRYRAAQTTCNTVSQGVTVASTNTAFSNVGYGQAPPPTTGYGQPPPPNMGYGQPPPPYK